MSEDCGNRLQELLRIEQLRDDVHLAGFQLGEIQNVVDQFQQRGAGDVDRPERILLFLIRHGAALEQFGEADYGIQRSPQLVAHRGQEVALGAVGGLRRLHRFG